MQTALSALINTQIYLLGQFAAKNLRTHFIRNQGFNIPPYNEHSNNKEQTTDTCNNTGDFQKLYAKQKKPITKDCVYTDDSTCMKF